MIQLETFTDYSLGIGLTNIKDYWKQAKALGLSAIALTDMNTLSGAVKFAQESESYPDILPILGATITYGVTNKNLVLFAKNRNGWDNLVKIVNRSPIVSLDTLRVYKDDILCGLGNRNPETDPDTIAEIKGIFGADWIGQIPNRPCYYVRETERQLKTIQLALANKATLKSLKADNLDAEDKIFLQGDVPLHLIGFEDVQDVTARIGRFSIANKPKLPTIKLADNERPFDHLTQLCRAGWKKKIVPILDKYPKMKDIYLERVKRELGVFDKANLSGYILIVREIMQFCHDNNIRCGLRGSAAGCIVSYSIDVSNIDPVRPDPILPYAQGRELSFERFFNPGRLNDKNISLADIDIDVESGRRAEVIDFIKQRYGERNVAYITTFSKMKARSAIKDIFRVMNVPNSFEVANRICSLIVPEDKISDVLQDLREEDPDYNAIDYAIDNVPEILPYYEEYKEEFEVAKRFAKIIKNHGRHAAGIVVCDTPIIDTFPTLYDAKLDARIAGLEMLDLEYAGGCKYDILGVTGYDRIHKVWDMVDQKLKECPVGQVSKTELGLIRDEI